ncbi:MAG TPA: hypothetical protein VEY90_04645 [Thermoleophilaceae bacterium]|jgi:hypothetical protein|nr:hypothetical protein [Thermoleophilaceae bacterium]
MKSTMLLAALACLVCAGAAAAVGAAGAGPGDDGGPPSFEVWLLDQQGADANGSAGRLHVFHGGRLVDDPSGAVPETVELGEAARTYCIEATASEPRRPHMLVFNGGDEDGAGGNTHAVIAYVASGHIAFLDADTREPVGCVDAGAQAHAAWPTPDQRHLIVANQNGKLLQRIATDYASDEYTLEGAATLDLAACTTPSGAPCESPGLRPDNAPICPRTTGDGAFTFVTLRGGGMFVIDHNVTPMRIVAEYDSAHVDDNGCGEMEAAGKMYVNSGAGAPAEPYGHSVYAFDLDAFGATPSATPNSPAARLVYSRDGAVDAHAVALTRHARYLWWGDRRQNDVTVVDTETDAIVNRFSLAGMASVDPAPDLFDLSPSGHRMFASLRGPRPASGHEASGSTPGVGVIQVLRSGRQGRLVGVAGVQGIGGRAPDPHGIRVRDLR